MPMKVVESKIENLSALILQKNSVVVLGFFDGVHLGHQEIFKTATAISHRYNLNLNVLTFTEKISHAKQQQHLNLMSNELKRQYLDSHYPISVYIELIIDDYLANMHPLEFLVWLQSRLKVKKIVVGNDFRYGRNRRGTIEDIVEVFGRQNVVVIDKNENNVSSSLIRQEIMNGDLGAATEQLGHELTVELKLEFKNEEWTWTWLYPQVNLKPGGYELVDKIKHKNWIIEYKSNSLFKFLDDKNYELYTPKIWRFQINKL